MEKTEETIKVDILSEESFLQSYNENEVATELIDYLIEELALKNKKSNIKIVINNKCNLQKDYKKMIVDGLNREHRKSLKIHRFYDIEQTIFFIAGVALLVLASLITRSYIANEVVVIIAWVPIWKMVEIELFEDSQGRRRRKAIKRLLRCEII